MSVEDVLIQYKATVIEVSRLEKQMKEFFDLIAIRDNPRFDRCADYGQRVIQIIIPLDEINLSLLTPEKIQSVQEVIIKHRELRNIQRLLEVNVDKENVIKHHLTMDTEAII